MNDYICYSPSILREWFCSSVVLMNDFNTEKGHCFSKQKMHQNDALMAICELINKTKNIYNVQYTQTIIRSLYVDLTMFLLIVWCGCHKTSCYFKVAFIQNTQTLLSFIILWYLYFHSTVWKTWDSHILKAGWIYLVATVLCWIC